MEKKKKITKDEDTSTAKVSMVVVRRLPRYFRYLRELLRVGKLRISSGELAKIMGVTATQIRQDLNCFGGFGQQGYGYNVKFLYSNISEILGATRSYRAVIIGTGKLGRALASSPVFEHRGVRLTALFDNDPDVIGKNVYGFTVIDASRLEAFCEQNRVDIAVLTLPREFVTDMATRLTTIGIKGIWNFTGAEIDLPESDLQLETLHMGDSLMTLCYRMNKKDLEEEEKLRKAQQ